MDRIDQAVGLYPNAGSMESGRRSAVTCSVPPRWAPSVRATVVTQRSSPVSAIPVGADPVTIVGVVAGPDPSCQIVPSSALATQTSSEATAMACGSRPAGIVSDTAVAPAATNEAVPSDRFVTQTPPSTDATPLGSVPTWMVDVTRWESASITETVPSVLLATQTFSPSLVMADGNPPTSIGRSAMPRTGSNAARCRRCCWPPRCRWRMPRRRWDRCRPRSFARRCRIRDRSATPCAHPRSPPTRRPRRSRGSLDRSRRRSCRRRPRMTDRSWRRCRPQRSPPTRPRWLRRRRSVGFRPGSPT